MGVDPYELLGVGRGATDEEIRSAYRNLARQLHPDASGDPETAGAFRAVTAAYDELRRRGRAGEGEPVPVQRGPAPRSVVAEPLRGPARGRVRVRPAEDLDRGPWRRPGEEPEPLLSPESRRGEPLRAPRGSSARPGFPAAPTTSRRRDLPPLYRLLGLDDRDED